jgi:osmoprotectant transport system ATP-binding protein
MIRVENLNKSYGAQQAVINLSFDVRAGENLVLLGTSGCGKTTTLRMINRLIAPDSGKIYIDNRDTSLEKPEILRRSIGYVLQNHGLFPHYSVMDNIAIVPKLLNWSLGAIQERASELMAKLNLDPSLKNMYPASLSGGQQQRVGLARALMVDPPVLLMDEPFGALDTLTRMHIRKDFLQLDELVRKTIILVTHDVQEAFELGDRICLMDKGRIVQIGRPEELLFKPENAFVKDFLAEHRLQLELKSVKLSALSNLKTEVNDQSVWDRMDALLNGDRGQEQTQEMKGLMNAFMAYKNT